MKQRQGWVSNSSSSSFVILGKKVQLDEIDLSKGKYVAFGEGWGDGLDVFDITPEILSELKRGDYWFDFMKVEHTFNEPYFTIVTINGTFNVWSGEVDYYTTKDVEMLIDRYGDRKV